MFDIKGWKVNHLVSEKDGAFDGFLPSILKIIVMKNLFLITLGLMLERAGRKYYPKLLTAIPLLL